MRTLIERDKSKINDMETRVEKFRQVLTFEIMRLRDNPPDGEYLHRWLDVDYDPCQTLANAAKIAGIPRSQFSIKSSVSMTENSLSVKFGYSANRVNYYPLPNGKWLLTTLSGTDSDMHKITNSVMNGNPLEFIVED